MMVAVHALTGAVLGGLCRRKSQAFLLGAASHLVADALPHRDLEVPVEAALLGAALGAVALFKGVDSRAFAGAVGAAAPDVENLVARLFDIPDEKLLVPCHRCYHGRKLDGVHGQVALATLCLALLACPRCTAEARA